MVLGWQTNIAPRWLDPLQHDDSVTPDNSSNAVHDALIKNFYDRKFDYLALAQHFDFAECQERNLPAPPAARVRFVLPPP